MVEKTVLDQQQESVEAQYLVPLIANGANGQLAVKPAETEVKRELKFQPNMVEEYAQGVQTKNAIWDHVPLTANGANGELAALHAVMGFRKESLSNKLNTVENNVIFFK